MRNKLKDYDALWQKFTKSTEYDPESTYMYNPATGEFTRCPHEVFTNGQKPSIAAEADPLGRSPKEPGSKLDKGKTDILRGAIQYFPKALEAVAKVSEYGANKYAWKGWESVPDGETRYGAALSRHLLKEDRELIDEESGFPHIFHTVWNDLARLELYLRRVEDEDKSYG